MENDAHLPMITKEQITRINKRAKKLAQAAYVDFRARMMADPLVVSGHTKPEDWQPADTSEDVFELIKATATSLAATSRSLNRRAERLAQITEKTA
ncbi:MAG: hypothetical protein ABII81_04675 [Pseudomonadota bacterium]